MIHRYTTLSVNVSEENSAKHVVLYLSKESVINAIAMLSLSVVKISYAAKVLDFPFDIQEHLHRCESDRCVTL